MISFSISLDEEDDDNVPSREKKEHTLYPPKKRGLNDNPYDDFVAIDFETMTRLRTSACAIGMVRVIDGNIAQRFYTLINPIRDDSTESEPNFRIHGIPLSEAEKAPDFGEVFPMIQKFIGDLKIVCHNRAIDIFIMKDLMAYYGLSGLDLDNNECTYALTNKPLAKCCEEYGIKMSAHHDALSDAEACAKIYLHCIGKPLISQSIGSLSDIYGGKSARKVDSQFRSRLEDDKILDKTTPFYKATVVITGVFDAYPERNDIAEKVQLLGAKVSSSISKKTSIVVVGDGAGPKKLEKINELKSEGCDIRIIYEPELLRILGE